MGTTERRERDRAARRATILATARTMAEADGWDAVTTRRLADRIEYSQPVLYSHFPGKAAIVAAVALDGFAELTAEMRRRAAAARDPRAALVAVVDGYLAYARDHPATYDAMFSQPTELRFAQEDTPAELVEGFAALRSTLAAATGAEDVDLRTELLWSTVHGLATLTAAGRVPQEATDDRVALLVGSLVGTPAVGSFAVGSSSAGSVLGHTPS